MSDEAFVPVYFANSLMEAEMIKGLLEGEGVMALIPGELASDPATTAEETAGAVRVDVPRNRLDRARAILTQAADEGRALEGWLAEHPGEDPED